MRLTDPSAGGAPAGLGSTLITQMGGGGTPAGPAFSDRVLLMPGNDLLDKSNDPITIEAATCTAEAADTKFGTKAMNFDFGEHLLYDTDTIPDKLQPGDDDFCVEGWVINDASAGTFYTGVYISGNTTTTYDDIANYTDYLQLGKVRPGAASNADYMRGTFKVGGTNYKTYSTGAISYGVWNYWALTRSGDTLRLFKDGVLQSNGDDEPTIGVGVNGTHTFAYSGRWSNQVQFDGKIEDLRITKGFPVYTENFTPPTEPHPTS